MTGQQVCSNDGRGGGVGSSSGGKVAVASSWYELGSDSGGKVVVMARW